jgi:hypothetical protein
MGFHPAVDLGGHRRGRAGLALQGRGLAVLDVPLADAADRVDVHAQGVGDLRVGPVSARPVTVTPEEDLGVPGLARGHLTGTG